MVRELVAAQVGFALESKDSEGAGLTALAVAFGSGFVQQGAELAG
ncbi:hypothetical protein [Deinococcus xinjiangensis]